MLKSCDPRAEADHVGRNNHVPVAGITEHLFEEHPFAIFAWYCMHVETRAMSDKYWMSDWLANDVIGVRSDVRIPKSPRYFGRDITSRHTCVLDSYRRVIARRRRRELRWVNVHLSHVIRATDVAYSE